MVSRDEDGFGLLNQGAGCAVLHADQLKRVRQIELVSACNLLGFDKSIEIAEVSLVHAYPSRTAQVTQQAKAAVKIILLRKFALTHFAFKHAECLCQTEARHKKAGLAFEILPDVFET